MNPWSGLDLVNDNDNNPWFESFLFFTFLFLQHPQIPPFHLPLQYRTRRPTSPRQPGSPAPDTAHAKQTLSRASPLSLLSATGPVCCICVNCVSYALPHIQRNIIYLIERDLYKKFQMYCLSGSPLIEKGISSKTKKSPCISPTAGNLVNVDNIRF